MPFTIPGLQLVIPGPDWELPPALPDNEDAKIWRYLDLPKFMSLLQTGSLFMSRADRLGDPLEGVWSDASVEVLRDHCDDEFIATALATHRHIRKHTWVSCWHLSERENEALWRIYSPNNQGVAIQSTVAKLLQVVPPTSSDAPVVRPEDGSTEFTLSAVSRVHYLDYQTTGPHLNNTVGPMICKRQAFEHEKELRAIVQSLILTQDRTIAAHDGGDEGISKKVELQSFIEKVTVDPLAPNWFFDVVEKVTADSEIATQVVRSSLSAPDATYLSG